MTSPSSRLPAQGQPDAAGRALVLLHGAGGNHSLWAPVHRLLLQSRLPVLALDLPGHGRSPGPAATTVSGTARTVAATLGDLGVQRAVVAGHSMGGAVALTLALEGDRPVAGLGVVSSGARLPVDPLIVQGARAALACTAEHLARFCFARGAPAAWLAEVSGAMLAAGAETLHADLTACSRFRVTAEDLARIRIPVDVVCGDLDVLTPPALSRELAAQIPGARLTLLPGCGHTPLLEAPEALAANLAGLWRRAFGGEGPPP